MGNMTKFQDQKATDYQVNANFNRAWAFSILNKIRQNIDRVSVDSAGQDDIFSEAYVDSNGQNNTVNTGATTALFDTNKYKPTFTINDAGTTESTGWSGTDISHTVYDGVKITVTNDCAIKSVTTFGGFPIVGGTCRILDSGKNIIHETSFVSFTATFDSVWLTTGDYFVVVGDSGASYASYRDGTPTFPRNGTNLNITTSITGNTETSAFGYMIGNIVTSTDITVNEVIIEHTIPANTYPATVSKLIGKVLFEDWESGITVQHRLENGSENSGWIDDGELGEFTAFTLEATKYLTKLTPKSSTPTPGFPSVRGSGFYAED